MNRRFILFTNPALRLALALALACAGSHSAFAAQESASSQKAPSVLGRVPDPAREPHAPAHTVLRAAARLILITHQESQIPYGSTARRSTRTKDEARALAGALSIVARSKGADFEALAREWSDDTASAPLGGFAGTFRAAKVNDVVGRNVLQIDLNCIVGPIDAQQGIYIIERIPVEEISWQQIVVTWGGVPNMRPVVRTRDEARARAADLYQKLKADPAAFESIAIANSDDPNVQERLGRISPVPRGEAAAELEAELLKSAPGEVHGPVETSIGYILFRRLPVEMITIDSLLIMHRDAKGSPITIVRTREEARARAEAVLAEAQKPNAQFARLVEEYSDDEADRLRKGRRTLGVSEGSSAHVRAIAAVPEGSAILYDAPQGFFVMKRAPLDRD